MSAADRARRASGWLGVALLLVAVLMTQPPRTASAAGEEPAGRASSATDAPSAAARQPVDNLWSAGSTTRTPGELEVDRTTAATPVRVRIPALGISSDLDRLGLDRDGALEKPPEWDVAGWYAGGPRPGATGPAVIAGHVDSPNGPAAFTGLDRIRPGEVVVVDDADGRHHSFTVRRTATTPKHGFPTRAVYGPTPDAQLRLITCSGPYVDGRGGYQDNLVVFATAT